MSTPRKRPSAPRAPRSIRACGFCRRPSARRCTKSIRSAAPSTTSPTIRGRAMDATRRSRNGAAISSALYAGSPPPQLTGLARAVQQFDLEHGDFLAVIAGMEMDVTADIRAPDHSHARPLLRPRRLRGRPAFGACLRHGARGRACAGASSRPRAAIDQYPARSRRGCCRSAGSICRGKHCARSASSSSDPAEV